MYNLIVEKLKCFNPLSIFIYGSMTNKTANCESDCEVGVIFDEKSYIKKSILDDKIKNEKYRIFPFKYSDLKKYNIDTPFEKNIYIYSLISGGAKTIYGQQIIENLPLPKIKKCNILSDVYFNLGIMLSSYRLFKIGDKKLCYELFYKAIFYATRDLLFAKTKEVINGYNNIYEKAIKLSF